jgi:hypothetical protein
MGRGEESVGSRDAGVPGGYLRMIGKNKAAARAAAIQAKRILLVSGPTVTLKLLKKIKP